MSDYIEIRMAFDRSLLDLGNGLCLSEDVLADIVFKHNCKIAKELIAYKKQIKANLKKGRKS